MFDLSKAIEIWIIAGLAVMAVLLLMSMLASCIGRPGRTKH
jgi:hypothetical protein